MSSKVKNVKLGKERNNYSITSENGSHNLSNQITRHHPHNPERIKNINTNILKKAIINKNNQKKYATLKNSRK